ncbi:hypothetical protein HY251_06985 [bacterium]|nr:hypothetical protein [bacterium]
MRAMDAHDHHGKFFSGIAAIVLAGSLVAGCGPGHTSSSGGTSAASTGPTAPSSSPPSPPPAPPASSGGVAPPTSVTGTALLNIYSKLLPKPSSLADLKTFPDATLKDKAFVLEDEGFVRVLGLSGPTPVSESLITLDSGGAFARGSGGSGVYGGSLGTGPGTTLLATASAFPVGSPGDAVYVFDALGTTPVTKLDLSTQMASYTGPTLMNSAGTPVPSPFATSFTASALISKGTLFVSSSNFDASFNNNPGTVIAYAFPPGTKVLGAGKTIITSSFNPGRLTRWVSPATGNEALLVMNAGAGALGATVDVIDPARGVIVLTIPIPAPAGGDGGTVAISPDGTHGFLGATFTGDVYELDLSTLDTALGNSSAVMAPGPFLGTTTLTTGPGSISSLAFSTSGKFLYACNSSTSVVYALYLGGGVAPATSGAVAGFARTGSPASFEDNSYLLAIRRGVPGIDFGGPALLVGTINLTAADATVPGVGVTIDGVAFDAN